MKRSNATLAFIFAGALVSGLGCGDPATNTGASAEPGKSGAAAMSGAPKGSAAAATGSSKPKAGDTKPASTSAAAPASGEALKFMPKACDEGRMYANVGKLFAGDAAPHLDALVKKGMAKNKDDKTAKAFEDLKAGGIDFAKAKEIAACGNAGDKVVVAVAIELPAAPADVVVKAMESGGQKAKKEEDGGVAYVTNEKEKYVLGFPGGNIMLVGKDKADLAAVAKGGDGAGEFGDATSHVVWAKVTGKREKFDLAIKEAGDNYDFKLSMATPPGEAAKMKEGMDKELPKMSEKIDKSPFKAASEVAKNLKFAAEGDNFVATTTFPKTLLANLLKTAAETDPNELMKALQ